MADLCETPLRDLPPATPVTLGLWTSAEQAARALLDAGAGEALVLDGGSTLSSAQMDPVLGPLLELFRR